MSFFQTRKLEEYLDLISKRSPLPFFVRIPRNKITRPCLGIGPAVSLRKPNRAPIGQNGVTSRSRSLLTKENYETARTINAYPPRANRLCDRRFAGKISYLQIFKQSSVNRLATSISDDKITQWPSMRVMTGRERRVTELMVVCRCFCCCDSLVLLPLLYWFFSLFSFLSSFCDLASGD